MKELITNLEPMLTKLSETFCVSVDMIKENAMQYILMYGRYELVTNIVSFIFMFMFIGGIILGVTVIISYIFEFQDEVNWKGLIKITALIVGGIVVLYIIGESSCYLISPEIYSINQVMELFKSVQ